MNTTFEKQCAEAAYKLAFALHSSTDAPREIAVTAQGALIVIPSQTPPNLYRLALVKAEGLDDFIDEDEDNQLEAAEAAISQVLLQYDETLLTAWTSVCENTIVLGDHKFGYGHCPICGMGHNVDPFTQTPDEGFPCGHMIGAWVWDADPGEMLTQLISQERPTHRTVIGGIELFFRTSGADDVMTPSEVAAWIGKSPETVYKALRAKNPQIRLKHERRSGTTYLILRGEVLRWRRGVEARTAPSGNSDDLE